MKVYVCYEEYAVGVRSIQKIFFNEEDALDWICGAAPTFAILDFDEYEVE